MIEPGSSSAAPGRRVVLLQTEGHVPDSLRRGLDEQGAVYEIVTSAAKVMVELARTPTHAVIVHRPAEGDHLNELLSAIRTYYPSVSCWAQDAPATNGAGGLRPIFPAGEVPSPPDEPRGGEGTLRGARPPGHVGSVGGADPAGVGDASGRRAGFLRPGRLAFGAGAFRTRFRRWESKG